MLACFFRNPRLLRPAIRRLFSASHNDYSKDLYKILGVPATADKAQIKSAFVTLVKTHHPDVNKSGENDTISDINIAYSILSHDEKKKDYDSYLESKNRMNDPRNFYAGSASTSTQQARTYTNVNHESCSGLPTAASTLEQPTQTTTTFSMNPSRSTRSV
jgi:DnaJ-class molecular chaperone